MFGYGMLNFILITLILLMGIAYLYLKLSKRTVPVRSVELPDADAYTIDAITSFVKKTLNEVTGANLYDMGLSEVEFERRRNKRAELKRALKGCTTGDVNDKTYVKEYIIDLLYKAYGFTEATANVAISFDDPTRLSVQDQFDILLHQYKQRFGTNGLSRLIASHELDRPRQFIEKGQTESYLITAEEIARIYQLEAEPLTLDDKIRIIVQRVYQYYKGFGVIDEIRDMAIDGVSGGVSGVPSSIKDMEDDALMMEDMRRGAPCGYESVWIFYRGKSIHLSFLSFGSDLELKRVCQNIYKYNNPGQLTESNGYKVNEMKDGSRVVVVRPPFAESWAFFVRKFELPNLSLQTLISDENGELVQDMIKFLMKGARITAVTGSQGSGKTTLLMAMVQYIPGPLTLRIQEMSFELHLRKLFPMRNILSFRETDHISGQQGLDVQKKTDGSVNILGEVATDPVAAWMIQMGQVASLFTIFSHHAKTFKDLIWSLRNSLLKTGVFQNERIAEQQVASVINFDIHLVKRQDGHRYIERITECIPIEEHDPYPAQWQQETSLEGKLDRFMDASAEFFRRSTDRKPFTYRNVIEYRDGHYEAVFPITDHNKREMLFHMNKADGEAFKRFVADHWRDGHVD
ncbi:Flp pilus assembly complex ATPase component TadA [Paenibacillus sp. ACRRX]|uniref:ATPase, T2SS/T4P/T4SS family n=1 Tax=unclassified Paenibacillus TaxID=185978 RepID=UPI001EF62A4A|nr:MULTISPECIES: ATPase, T2SS/T4P/T4SS family [unclassified Paenibacillus]MCG7409171.1 Flp pilus assembly complex ATPase component TadA [Paenibacillus sp. ACRRX]MDK8181835.1 ATPase, T2SS/T4P/T4SS family [Paenibacillus sp. UMB4589-SE434]